MEENEKRKAKITPVHSGEAARLRHIWEETANKPSQAAFGEQYDIGTQPAVGFFLNGKTPLSLKAARGFATGLNCSIEDFSPRLALELKKLSSGKTYDLDEFQTVRHADVSFSNGTGQVVYAEDDRPPLMFRIDFLRKLGIFNGDAVVVDADGSSNEPKIFDGSVILVNRGDKERLDGDFFAFRCDGELLIKRLQHLEGIGILATAENPNFRPKQKIYKDLQPDSFEVIGRAVWMGAKL